MAPREKDWFKYRGYPHISEDIPFSKKKDLLRYIQSPRNIARHSFLPLISKNIIQRRYKLNHQGRRSHRVFKKGEWQSTRKVRVIEYPCHKDSHIYSYYSQKIVQPYYEELLKKDALLNSSVIAYRKIPIEEGADKNRCNIHFAKEVFDEIKSRENCVALLYDIENFFPSLDHKLLKLAWAKVLGKKTLPKDHYNIFKSITKYSFVNLNDLKVDNRRFDEKKLAEIRASGRNSYFHSVKDFLDSDIKIYKNPHGNKGIPHGLPISALMANIYMFEFDQSVAQHLSKNHNVYYRRYSDDMIFICKKSEVDIVNKFVLDQIKNIKLIVAPDKTEKVYFEESNGIIRTNRIDASGKISKGAPLNYLGFEFYGHKTLIKSKNIGGFYREMKESVNRKHRRVERLKQKYLLDDLPIFKRKIYRLYSYKGIGPRKLVINQSNKNKKRVKDYRGNFISYVRKSSEIMGDKNIERQVRNHWRILQATINKYNFSNRTSNRKSKDL